MGILLFFLALGLLIAFHELGHYLFARLFKVRVNVFSIGFGPTIVSKRVGGTEYRIALIPLGGYVKLAGELDEKVVEPEDPSSFTSKPRWQRLVVYLAGPVFSFLLGFIILLVSYTSFGVPVSRITQVQHNSPAEKSGIKPGDEILEINDKRTQSLEEVVGAIVSSPKDKLDIKIKRDGTKDLDISVKPEATNGTPKIGIGIEKQSVKDSKKAITMSLSRFTESTGAILSDIWNLLSGKVKPADGLVGPIGIADISNQVSSSRDWPFLFELWALISINLGIMNLFPLAVLDGGQIAILLLEMIAGRSFNQKTKVKFMMFGAALILSLMLYVVYLDITRLFQ